MAARFAAFDIDGTVFRWQLYHLLFDAFNDDRLIDTAAARNIIEARERWRARQSAYDEYEHELIRAMQPAIIGLSEARFNRIADRILEANGHHTYRYTLTLLKELREQGYVIIAISGSYRQLVERFAALHGIDIAIGRDHAVVKGKLTAESTEIFGRKGEVLRELVDLHELTFEGSYGVGDSGGDIGMLEIVDHPIAFNPDERLLTVATEKGWPVVTERKNIAYRMERGENGLYILAEARPL